MRHSLSMLAAFASLSGLLALAGCVGGDLGMASSYRKAHESKISVTMPAGAPSISQQFFIDPAGAKHPGIDVINRIGTPVIAPADGVVTESFFEPMYGNRVVIDHGANGTGLRTYTVYKHLSARMVKPGDRVQRGQRIASLGNTGTLAGGIPHLHFEVQREVRPKVLRPVDPHRVWLGGVGKVTCFDPAGVVETDEFRTTYPVPCQQ